MNLKELAEVLGTHIVLEYIPDFGTWTAYLFHTTLNDEEEIFEEYEYSVRGKSTQGAINLLAKQLAGKVIRLQSNHGSIRREVVCPDDLRGFTV